MSRSRYASEFTWIAFGISLIICLAITAFAWYLILPAINVQYPGFWWMIILGLGSSILISVFFGELGNYDTPRSWITLGIIVLLIVILLIFMLLSSQVCAASKFEDIAQIKTDGIFSDDIPAIDSSDDIPTIDKATAQKLGDRSMGAMAKYISQYEVSNEYNLICYNGKYYRVSPLMYGSNFKAHSNRNVGIPGYVLVDVYTGKVELVELEGEETIRYAPSAIFGNDLTRYLRSKYPTKVFAEANFEIDDEGIPHYIVPTLKVNAGVFGAPSIDTVLIVNAVNGDVQEYSIDKVPEWVDNVYDVTRIMQEIDWKYSLVHGAINLSDRDVRKTSYEFDKRQYYAIPKDGHVYIYTGVTSAGSDESNIGFLLINMRDGKATYYADPGAEESSAQTSALGLIPGMAYSAGPVMLVNINEEQTYFFALKDSQLLVKKYALVNKTDYTIVVVEDTIEKAVDVYQEKLGLVSTEPVVEAPIETKTVTGIVSSVYEVTMNGNTMFIIYLDGKNEIYVSSITNSFEQPARLIIGATVTMNYCVENGTNIVNKITFVQ